MASTIVFRRGNTFPSQGSGITLAEPVFNTSQNTFHIGLGHGVTAEWVGAPITGLSASIASGEAYKIPTAAAVKNYVTDYVTAVNGVLTVNGFAGGVTLSAGTGVSVAASSGSITITNTGVQSFNGTTGAVQGVGSFNGITGTVQGVSAAVAGTGISVSGATGAVTITNTGVQSFNGLTGAVTGVTVGGANTFTALQSFNAGISASGGITFANDIFVNGIRMGRGGAGDLNSVAIGSDVLPAGTFNVAIGKSALKSAVVATNNVAIGFQSGMSGDSPINNVSVGANSLRFNVFGQGNVAIGYEALYSTTNNANTAIGSMALRSTSTGIRNTSIGNESLYSNTSGVANVAIGHQAGRYRGEFTAFDFPNDLDNEDVSALSRTTGTGGIYIGQWSRASANGTVKEIVIGAEALGLGSNTAVIGATSQVSATIYGTLNLPSGLSASGATFSGNIAANNIVNSVNGKTGGITLAAGTGITLNTAGNTITVAITSASTTQTIDFSDTINQIEVVMYGLGVDFFTSLKYSENWTVNSVTFDTGTTAGYSAVFERINSFYDPTNGWSARLVIKPPFTLGTSTTAEGVIGETINTVYIDATNGATSIVDYWSNIQSQTLLHKEATYRVKTVTGQTWVTPDSFITCKVLGLTTGDHIPEDASLEGVRFEIDNIVAGTGFDIIGHAPEGTYGKYSVKCLGQ